MVAVKKTETQIRDIQSTVLALHREGYNRIHIDLPTFNPDKPWSSHVANVKAWRYHK